MTVLRTHGVGVAWSASGPVFQDVTLVLEPGLYGLVGANGAGKSSLLAVLSGVLAPHEGSISLEPRDAVVAYCPQGSDDLGAGVSELAQRDDALARELRARLRLDPDWLERWATLSPGERQRWQLAAALAREPDVLLLDEPTNHLDADARGGLIAALRRFAGVGVVVSHDRALLDDLTRRTLRMHGGRVANYDAPYSKARASWRAERDVEQEQHASARHRLQLASARLADARRSQAATGAGVGTRARMKDKNDSDARSILATNKANWADARAGRSVGRARVEEERARRDLPVIERDPTLGSKVFVNYERAPHPALFHLDRDELNAGSTQVLRDVRLTIGREERVRIEGANGAGKTTLLTALMGALRRPDRVLYLPQELAAEQIEALHQRLSSSSDETRGRVLSLFAALGSEPARIVRGDPLRFSPGESRKLALAEALGRHVWALVLDEPTNHLDLPSIERLEAALAAYPGCVVLVTHDDHFAENVTTRSLRLAGGALREG